MYDDLKLSVFGASQEWNQLFDSLNSNFRFLLNVLKNGLKKGFLGNMQVCQALMAFLNTLLDVLLPFSFI